MRSIPTFIDVEASGFGRGSYPIEVGMALPDRSTHCFIIRPEPGWNHWDASAEALHRIPRSLLQAKGRSVGDVARRLNSLLAGRKVYSDAWSQDISWLGKLFDAAGLPQQFRIDSVRALLSESEAGCWHRMKRKVIADTRLIRHRASADARILQETLLRLRARHTPTDRVPTLRS